MYGILNLKSNQQKVINQNLIIEQEFQQKIIDSEEANEIWEYIKDFYGINSRNQK